MIEFMVPVGADDEKAMMYEASIKFQKFQTSVAELMETTADDLRINFRLNTWPKKDKAVCLDTEADFDRLIRAVLKSREEIQVSRKKSEKAGKEYRGPQTVSVTLGDRGSKVNR